MDNILLQQLQANFEHSRLLVQEAIENNARLCAYLEKLEQQVSAYCATLAAYQSEQKKEQG